MLLFLMTSFFRFPMLGLFSDPIYDFFDFPESFGHIPCFYDSSFSESIDQRIKQVLGEELGIGPHYRYYPNINIGR